MIYIYYGNDTKKSAELARRLVINLQKKKPEAEYFKMTDLSFDRVQAEGLIKGQGLFSSNHIVYFDGIFKNLEAKEFIFSVLKDIETSSSIFIIREGKLDKSSLKKLEDRAEQTQACVLDESRLSKDEKLALEGEKISFFEYTDALSSRDKKKIWTMVLAAIAKGVPIEEIHGIFFYQVKTMILAMKAKTPKESGLNPYVYSKARIGGEKYGLESLIEMSSDLIDIYHLAHRGEIDFALGIERWVLDL